MYAAISHKSPERKLKGAAKTQLREHHHDDEYRRTLKLRPLNPPSAELERHHFTHRHNPHHVLLKMQGRLSYENSVLTSFNLPTKVHLLLQELESRRRWQNIIEVITTQSAREILTSPRSLLNSRKCLHMALPVRKLFSKRLQLRKRLIKNQDINLFGK